MFDVGQIHIVDMQKNVPQSECVNVSYSGNIGKKKPSLLTSIVDFDLQFLRR